MVYSASQVTVLCDKEREEFPRDKSLGNAKGEPTPCELGVI